MGEDFFKKVNPLELTDWRKKVEEKDFSIILASKEDWRAYKNIYIEALTEEPEAFNINSQKMNDIEETTDAEWEDNIENINENNKPITLFAKFKDEVVGIVRAMPVDKGKKIWVVRSVYVRKEYRGDQINQNIAFKMLKDVLNRIKNEGGGQSFLIVKRTQKPAIKLYTKLGFKEVSGLGEMSKANKLLKYLKGNIFNLLDFKVMEFDFNQDKEKL